MGAPIGSNPLSPGDAAKTPKISKPSSPAATEVTLGSNRVKIRKKSSPSLSPRSFGLGTAGGVPTEGDLAQPWVEKTPQSSRESMT
jgi:hypothetical protein